MWYIFWFNTHSKQLPVYGIYGEKYCRHCDRIEENKNK